MVDDIVRRCREGDENAFQELFRIHGEMIQKISFRMTRNTEWQRDIFQNVVELVINNIASFRGECKFTTWLYRITVNAALHFLQRERLYGQMPSIDESNRNLCTHEECALDRFERKEMFGRIMTALLTLPREYQNVISLYYFAERKIEEITDMTGKSSGAIKAMLWKGRRAIVKRLKKEGLVSPL